MLLLDNVVKILLLNNWILQRKVLASRVVIIVEHSFTHCTMPADLTTTVRKLTVIEGSVMP